MFAETYKGYRFVSFAVFDDVAKFWVPKAEVEGGKDLTENHETLTGPHRSFKTEEEAEEYSINMSREWLDWHTRTP